MHKFYADYMYKVQENKSILMVFSFLSYGPNYNVFHLDGKSEEVHHSVVVDFDMSQRQCVPLCRHRYQSWWPCPNQSRQCPEDV